MFGLGFHFFVKDDASLAMQRIDKAFRGTAESAEEMYYKTKASLDSMEGRFGALSDARVQAALRNTGMVLMGIGAAGLAGAGMAVKASIDYEDAFAGVRKTVDATEEEYAVLNARIRQMAKKVPIAATSIAKLPRRPVSWNSEGIYHRLYPVMADPGGHQYDRYQAATSWPGSPVPQMSHGF